MFARNIVRHTDVEKPTLESTSFTLNTEHVLGILILSDDHDTMLSCPLLGIYLNNRKLLILF